MNRLQRWRKFRQLSQSQLSELSGVNVRTLQDYEQGRKDINKVAGITLYNLAKALECNIEDLLNIEREDPVKVDELLELTSELSTEELEEIVKELKEK